MTFKTFVVPPKAEVGVIHPEISDEGQRVIHSDGEQVSWSPPPPRPVMPDLSQIKSLQRYFNRTGFQVWPAWLYHQNGEQRLVKNGQEAAELGVCYREATQDERGRFGLKAVWDWQDDSLWRPLPWETPKFDPNNPGQGKTVIIGTPTAKAATAELLEAVIPAVTAAVVASLKAGGNGTASANVDPKQWDDFLKFQAWQKTQQIADELKKDEPQTGTSANALTSDLLGDQASAMLTQPNTLAPNQERAIYEEEAARKGIKVGKNWSLERLKSEVEKAP